MSACNAVSLRVAYEPEAPESVRFTASIEVAVITRKPILVMASGSTLAQAIEAACYAATVPQASDALRDASNLLGHIADAILRIPMPQNPEAVTH
jgi:hypothetical protein